MTMATVTKLLILSIPMLIVACAPSFQLNENTVAMRNSMSGEEALRVAKKQLFPGDRRGGVCASSHPTAPAVLTNSPAKIVSMEGTVVTYIGKAARAVAAEASGRISAGTFQINTKYETYDVTFKINLTKIKEVRVLNNEKQLYCQVTPGAMAVMLYEGHRSYINVHVFPEDMDSFLAAILNLSPGAKVTKE